MDGLSSVSIGTGNNNEWLRIVSRTKIEKNKIRLTSLKLTMTSTYSEDISFIVDCRYKTPWKHIDNAEQTTTLV